MDGSFQCGLHDAAAIFVNEDVLQPGGIDHRAQERQVDARLEVFDQFLHNAIACGMIME